ncbi:MAG: phosphodiester glycosidase family protein [Lachnospiraceae bacterium]|nr:phosphodiester glycosidase family protein [Lachnospiraceae bacterium]
MKKVRSYFFTLFLVILMLGFASCGQETLPEPTPTPTAEPTEAPRGNEVAENVYHDSFSVTSTENGNTVEAQSLTFHPADGYLPVVYATYAGWASTLDTHFEKAAEERWGYEVVGVINGSFFSMTDGMLTGITITDGRITCAHTGFSGEMVTFGTDGVMRVTKSALEYKLSVNGKEYENALHYFNKVSQAGAVSEKIYYWDSACGSKSDAPEAGYELLFNKINHSELSVGGTLIGELVSVTETTEETRGVAIGSNQFVLYCKTASPYAGNLKTLKPGAQVRIEVSETIEESREIMENCSSAITNVGWLVKDGEDQTQIRKTIGTHSVVLEARWTAFGTKPDGSYVFFTTEGQATGAGGSVTLRDVARVMIELGCTNVIRMDGGGSSAMYLCDKGDGTPGFVQESARAVSDCIMLVKRSSMLPAEELKTSLQMSIATAEQLYEQTKSEEVNDALVYAKEVIAGKDATEGDYKKAGMELANAVSYIEDLKKLIASAESTDKAAYTEYAFGHLSDSVTAGKNLLENNAAKEELVAAYNDLLYWYTMTGEIDVNVAAGKAYTTNIASNTTYPDTDNKELTDGKLGDATNTYSAAWAGFNGISGGTYDVIVDLGESVDGLSRFSVNAHQQSSWGIKTPSFITVFVSEDGNTWTPAAATAVSPEITESLYAGAHTLTANATKEVSGRYIKFALTPAGQFVFISEVMAEVHYK